MHTIANNSDNPSARCKVRDPHKLASDLGIHYFGDTNLEYGGLFFNSTNWVDYGYADAVRVTDLDSACGFTGGVLIERITILRDQVESALDYVGHPRGEQANMLQEIEACASYGLYDPCSDYSTSTSAIISADPESMEHDSWQAEKHVSCDDLLGFVHAEWMSEF